MMMKRFALLASLLLFAAPAVAQQELDVAKIYLNGTKTLTSGSGSPEGVVTAVQGSFYLGTGIVYVKATGSGNTGWVAISLVGSGTTNTIAKWTGTTTLGDSTVTDTAGAVNVGSHLLPTLTDTYDIGSPLKLWNQGYLAQLNAILFALETQTLLGGYSTIGYNAGSFAAAVTSGATTINFGTTMTPGHFVVVRAHDTGGTATAEYLLVGSNVSGTTYNVTRNLSGLGAKNWAQGVPFLVLGTTGTGRIDLLAYDGKPRIQFVEQGATYNAQTVRGVLGNLNGYYGYGTDTNGLGVGTPSGARVTVDPTNGIIIYGGDNDAKFTADASGNATFDGKLTVGTGRNKIRNSECRVGTEDWSAETNAAVAATVNGPSFTPWRLLDESNTCYVTNAGSPANLTVSAARLTGQHFPVTPTLRYEASAYLGVHAATWARVMILWYDSSDVFISSSDGNQCTTASSGGEALSTWCRSGIIGTAPTGAEYAIVYLQILHSGAANPFMFYVRTYFGESGSAQEDLTEWGPAGITEITEGMIKTGAIITRTLAADSVTSAKIVAGTIVASDIAAATITGTQIAATTITASNLNVSTLSAITGNMGTLTAGSITGGTIDGAEIRAGSGDELILNSTGMTFTNGSSYVNRVNWNDGGSIGSTADSMLINSDSIINIQAGGVIVQWNSGRELVDFSDTGKLGTSSDPWGNLYTHAARVTALGGSGGTAFVCTDNDGDVYPSATTCDGSAPAAASVSALEQRIASLAAEVEELRAQVATQSATQAATRAIAHRSVEGRR